MNYTNRLEDQTTLNEIGTKPIYSIKQMFLIQFIFKSSVYMEYHNI